jgi:hypothetical protein
MKSTPAGNMIPIENHLISLEDLFGLNPKQTRNKTVEKEISPLFF